MDMNTMNRLRDLFASIYSSITFWRTSKQFSRKLGFYECLPEVCL